MTDNVECMSIIDMSFETGWSAINTEMPDRVPRTEYSADFHWELVKSVTGISIDEKSSESERKPYPAEHSHR